MISALQPKPYPWINLMLNTPVKEVKDKWVRMTNDKTNGPIIARASTIQAINMDYFNSKTTTCVMINHGWYPVKEGCEKVLDLVEGGN